MQIPGSRSTVVPSALVITEPALSGFAAMLNLGGADHCIKNGSTACKSARARFQVWRRSKAARVHGVLVNLG